MPAIIENTLKINNIIIETDANNQITFSCNITFTDVANTETTLETVPEDVQERISEAVIKIVTKEIRNLANRDLI